MRSNLNKTKYLNETEADALEKTLMRNVDSADGKRDCLLLLTLLYTGGRANEVLSIKPADLSEGTVLIHGSKGSNDREVPIPNFLYDRLLKFNPASERIFTISYKRLFQIWQSYRPVKKKLHSLRHTFAIRQLRKHGRLDVIKKLLGHRKIENTMIYSDYAFTMDEFRKLVI